MASIECNADKTMRIPVPLEKLLALLIDIPVVGKLWSDVETVTDIGDNQYRYRLIERSTVGMKFRGEYIAKYENNGKDEVTWHTLEGNMDSRGHWRLYADGDGTRANLKVVSTITMPVPKLLMKAVRIFAEREMDTSVAAHLDNISKHLR